MATRWQYFDLSDKKGEEIPTAVNQVTAFIYKPALKRTNSG